MPRAQFVEIETPDTVELLAIFHTEDDARAAALAFPCSNLVELAGYRNAIAVDPTHPRYEYYRRLAKLSEVWVTDPYAARGASK